MSHATDKSIEWYLSRFKTFEDSLNGESKLPIHVLRRTAIEKFAELGFPTTKNEEWRFTNITPILKAAFVPSTRQHVRQVSAGEIEKFMFGGLKCHRLVFLNGHFAPGLSGVAGLPPGTMATSLASVLTSDGGLLYRHLGKQVNGSENAFTALNTGFMQDGAFVRVPDNVILEEPIHMMFVSLGGGDPLVSNPRNLILVGNDSQVSLVESYVSLDGGVYLTNAVTEMVAGERSVIEHDKYQDESLSAFHIGTTHFQQSAGSNVVSNSIAIGGSIVRNNVTVVLAGKGVEATLNGLSLATGQQLVDNHTTIDHAEPNCTSHELYKAILDGKSRGVFNGKIYVRVDAQKTDAKQTNKTLLLSDDAMVDTKPQLEIFADDVKCTHGATVGQLDEEQVFYLRSRGLSEETARDILTFAFAGDVISRIHVEPLRERLDSVLAVRLRKGREEVAS